MLALSYIILEIFNYDKLISFCLRSFRVKDLGVIIRYKY